MRSLRRDAVGTKKGDKKMKKTMLLLLILTILIISCDRFDRDFAPGITIEEFVQLFETTGTLYLKENNIPSLMNFYSNNYLNDGMSKSGIQNFFSSHDWTENAEISLSNYTNSNSSFYVTIKDQSIDTTWVDYIRPESEKYVWIGNQISGIEDSEYFVISQSFTYITCQNCPLAAVKLQEVESIYPYNFIYLKYHINDALSLYNRFNDEWMYYGQPNPPHTVFQGRITLSGTSQLDSYQPIVDGLMQENPELAIENLSYTVSDRTVEGSVDIDFKEVNTENLYLHYLIYEKEREEQYVYGGRPYVSNVVRARGMHLLENVENQASYSFELLSPVDIPDDGYLVVWVQRMANTNLYSEGDMIYNAIREKIKE